MSTASFVPTTKGSDGSVLDAVKQTSIHVLAKDSFLRYRKSSGFSFARALAFQVVLTIIPGLIALVGISAQLGESQIQSMLREAATSLAPGPASDLLLTALDQGSDAARSNRIAIVTGGLAALVSAVTAMSQVQRGSSRIYGVLEDRETMRRYGLATAMVLSAGALIALGFLLVVIAPSFEAATSDLAQQLAWLRWPIAIGVVTAALALMFKVAPNREQPELRWLTIGGGVAVVGWLAVSAGLAMFLNASTTFGDTYGPLAGFMGVMLWAQLSSIVILYGLSVSAQLEAVRAGEPDPTVEVKDSDGAPIHVHAEGAPS